MDFKVEKQPQANREKYSREQLDIAYKFTEKAYKEFGSFVKAIVLFGSSTRKNPSEEGDIDILIIVDDVSTILSPEAVEAYRIIVQNLITNISSRLHVTTLKLTSFWDYIRQADPVALNILRDGFSIIDTGFFDPIQNLLRMGRIRPTAEAIWNYYVRAPATLQNSKWHLFQATLDLYWAAIDASHAALMKMGEVPPSPEHVADLMDAVLVKKKIINKKYSDTMRNLYEISRKILHREKTTLTGGEYQKLYQDTQDLIIRMRDIVEKGAAAK